MAQDKNKLKETLFTDDLSSMLDSIDDCEVIGEDEVWKNINIGISKRDHMRQRFALSRVAAAVILLIGLTYGYYNVWNAEDYITIVTAELNQPKQVILPDGTEVLLSRNSQLTYPKVFGKDSRHVEFEGMAYFSVCKDAERPFTIDAPQSKVKVLGTSFSMTAYRGELSEEVFLEEGSVALSSRKSELVLVPGEIATVNTSSKTIVKKVNINRNVNAWKTRQLLFDNDPLDYVFVELEKYYGKRFIVEDRSLLDLRFNGRFNDASEEDILQVLNYTLGISYVVNDNNILLKK